MPVSILQASQLGVCCVLCAVCNVMTFCNARAHYAKCQHAQKLAALGESSVTGAFENASMRMYYVVALGLRLLAGGFNHNTGGASGSILECCPIARRFDSAQLQFLFLLFCFFANGGIQGLALVGYWQMPAFAN